jgi:hypothetical protein
VTAFDQTVVRGARTLEFPVSAQIATLNRGRAGRVWSSPFVGSATWNAGGLIQRSGSFRCVSTIGQDRLGTPTIWKELRLTPDMHWQLSGTNDQEQTVVSL